MPNTFIPNRDDHNEIFKPSTYFVSETVIYCQFIVSNGKKYLKQTILKKVGIAHLKALKFKMIIMFILKIR